MKSYINICLLFSSLTLLSSCDWIKDKVCTGCAPKDQNISASTAETASIAVPEGEYLLSINNKPSITTAEFESFWQNALESNPQLQAISTFYPKVREDVFTNTLVPLEVAKFYVQDQGKSQDPQYQEKIKQQIAMFEKALALEVLKEDILKEIDKSDATLEKFYEENSQKVSAFQQPPFIKNQAGVKALSVEFSDEKKAKEFEAKVKQSVDFKSLAESMEKPVKDLGLVTMDSKNVDPAVRFRLSEIEPNEVATVEAGNSKFIVVKAVDKQEASYLPFEELHKMPEAKSALEQVMIQQLSADLLNKKLEELKKKYNVKENKEFFQKEQAAKQAEMEKSMKKEENAKTGEAGAAEDKSQKDGASENAELPAELQQLLAQQQQQQQQEQEQDIKKETQKETQQEVQNNQENQ